jgi:hypothetical protein
VSIEVLHKKRAPVMDSQVCYRRRGKEGVITVVTSQGSYLLCSRPVITISGTFHPMMAYLNACIYILLSTWIFSNNFHRISGR